MKFTIKGAVLLTPMLALATPALASPPATLNDVSQPGSVIIYPKFIAKEVSVDGITFPQTEIEIGAVCPSGVTCPENEKIKIRFHWVCPGAEGVNSNICPETSFDVTALTINGKLAFSPDGIPINSNSPTTVRAAPCARGYLIGWVINPANDLPIKFDALIGNAVIRNPNNTAGPNTGSSTGLSAYSAIPVQANTIDAVGATLSVPLDFDGAAGGYQQLTDTQVGDVRFDKTSAGNPLPNVLSLTSLNFLTLDVLSGQPNNPTFVPLNFYNENQVGTDYEGYEFVCWDQVPLSALAGGVLTQAIQGTRKGIVIAGPARKIADGNAPGDHTGPVTLIGLVETIEGTAANGFLERKYNFNMVSANVPASIINTEFVPVP
jgi:hypothetical protein